YHVDYFSLFFLLFLLFFFFFQAEDGIRDFHVTGVQTCALPILRHHQPPARGQEGGVADVFFVGSGDIRKPLLQHRDDLGGVIDRSEERRVGKEWRSRWGGDHEREKKEKEWGFCGDVDR